MTAAPHLEADAPPIPDQDEIAALAAGIMEPGRVYEVRAPKTKRDGPRRFWGAASGYFDNPLDLARSAAGVSGADADRRTRRRTSPRRWSRSGRRRNWKSAWLPWKPLQDWHGGQDD